MKIWIASDHAGVEFKKSVVDHLAATSEKGAEIHDLGPSSTDSVDYPDYADLVANEIHGSLPAEAGILICGSGQGMVMRANRHPHLRAALCSSVEIAQLAREHNDANVLCMGSRFTSAELALQMVDVFLATAFAGGRHSRRVNKLSTPV